MFHSIIKQDVTDIVDEIGSDLHKLEGMNILITGASGMLASYIVYLLLYANEKLFKKPAHLYLISRSKKEKFGRNKYIHYLTLDIAKAKPDVTNVHYIIHAASKAAPKLYEKNMIDTLNTNILGLYNVLALCSASTKSVLFFSSAEIYGSPSDNKAITEEYLGTIDHLNQRSCYVEAKKVCETICLNYFREKNIPVKIARIFHTFGPGINLDDGRVFSDFIRYGLQRNDIQILGDPTLLRSMLYVKDATIMFVKILLSDRNGEVYNVGSQKNIVSIKEFARIVCKTFNAVYKEKIRVKIKKDKNNTYFKNAVKCIKPSLEKFKRDFGYQPTSTIEEAAQRTIRYFLEVKKENYRDR